MAGINQWVMEDEFNSIHCRMYMTKLCEKKYGKTYENT